MMSRTQFLELESFRCSWKHSLLFLSDFEVAFKPVLSSSALRCSPLRPRKWTEPVCVTLITFSVAVLSLSLFSQFPQDELALGQFLSCL